MKKFLCVFLKFIIFFMSWALLVAPLGIPFENIKSPELWRLSAEITPLIAIIIVTIIFTRFIEKKKIAIPLTGELLKNSLLGLILGTIWLAIPVTIFLLTGAMEILGYNEIPNFYIWIFASFFNVCMQTLLVRGYLYQLIKTNYNTVIAIISTTILFTLLHGGAFEAGLIAVLNVVTMSIFVSLLLEYTNSLVAPIIVHFIWNTVGALLFGGVNLASDYPVLLHTVFSQSSAISGGIYKFEGSILILLTNSALAIVFYV